MKQVYLVGLQELFILDGSLAELMLPGHSIAKMLLEEPLMEVLQTLKL
jgi:hypothetical protein